VGGSRARSKDFNDPETVISPFLASYPDPQVRSAIARADLVNGSRNRARAWASVDRLLVSKAVAIPWLFETAVSLRSNDVAGVADQWNGGTWDFDFSDLR
jgi:hypothetical protein